MKEKAKIIPVCDVDKNLVYNFLQINFSHKKAEFLINHGEWLHKGNQNRFILEKNNIIIGYFGIIPTSLQYKGLIMKAFWWTDLIISKDYRGMGFQSIIDNYIRHRDEVKLGFPNANAAKIHKKHNWFVNSKSKVMMYPIKPSKFYMFKGYESFVKVFLDMPHDIYNIFKNKSSLISKIDTNPQARKYEKYSNFEQNQTISLVRDDEFISWRYINSPYKKDHVFYYCEKSHNIKVGLILRKVKTKFGLTYKILDLFGSVSHLDALDDLLNLVIKNAIKNDIHCITILESNYKLQWLLFKKGFYLFSTARFCLYMNDDSKYNDKICPRFSLADADLDF